jgi:hypothetical protein
MSPLDPREDVMTWSHPFYAIHDGDLPHVYVTSSGFNLDFWSGETFVPGKTYQHTHFRVWRPSTPDRPLFRFNTEIDILRRMALGVGLSAHAEQQWLHFMACRRTVLANRQACYCLLADPIGDVYVWFRPIPEQLNTIWYPTEDGPRERERETATEKHDPHLVLRSTSAVMHAGSMLDRVRVAMNRSCRVVPSVPLGKNNARFATELLTRPFLRIAPRDDPAIDPTPLRAAIVDPDMTPVFGDWLEENGYEEAAAWAHDYKLTESLIALTTESLP